MPGRPARRVREATRGNPPVERPAGRPESTSHSGLSATHRRPSTSREMRGCGTRGGWINHVHDSLATPRGFKSVLSSTGSPSVRQEAASATASSVWVGLRRGASLVRRSSSAQSRRSHSPFGRSLSCWGVHTLEQDGADRPDLVNNGPYRLLVASPGLWCLPDGNACQGLGGTHGRVPIQND